MIQDLRFAVRMLLRTPTFTLAAVVTLALGIGANAAIFSVVYAILLKPLPFAGSHQLIYVHDSYPSVQSASVSWPKYQAFRDGNRTLTALGAIAPAAITLTGRGEPQQLAVSRVSGDFFDVFKTAPLTGRTIGRSDDLESAEPVIVLSYGLWQRVFGGDPAVLGQTIRTDGRPRLVIGIMPPEGIYPARTDGWIPLAVAANAPNGNFLRLVGRLKENTTLERATADLEAIGAAFNQANGTRRGIKTYLLQDFLSQNNRRILLVLQGAVLAVLLVACANVTNMLLARSVARRRELSIRAAIGASGGRLVRQLLTESVVLAAIGGGAGVLLAGWLVRLFVAIAPSGFAGVQSIRVDGTVLAFAAFVAVATGVIFGVAPARGGLRADANETLREGGTRTATGSTLAAGRVLVVAEIGLAIMLALGAGVMVKSLLRLQSQDAGVDPDGLMTFQIALPNGRYDTDQTRQMFPRIVEAVATIPGVKSAGAINYLPLINFGFNGPFAIVGREPFPVDRSPAVEYRIVAPGYFETMGIPLRRGQYFSARDDERERPVVIINETMARRFWPDQDPIGARVQLGVDIGSVTREIVGVVADVRSRTLDFAPVPETFVPHAQVPASSMGVAVRTAGDPLALLPAVRERIGRLDPDLPIIRPLTMEAIITVSTGSMRLSSTLTALFAFVAGLLACLGIFGLVSYAVAQRTREIGIRVALGANPVSVLRLIVGDGVKLASIGIAFGAVGTWLLTSTIRSLLYEVSPSDPAVLAATCAGAFVLTALASLIPAMRVMRVDPSIALRVE
jgi:putative ABC transport system permease protein